MKTPADRLSFQERQREKEIETILRSMVAPTINDATELANL
jgi:hypothetical protein